MNKIEQLQPFDKYFYYQQSVQSSDIDVEFFEKVYREIRNRHPKTLREDFCGAFSVCCEWVKRDKVYQSFGVDLDPEPLQYGKDNNLSKLDKEAQERVEIAQMDVLEGNLPSVDIVCALNFSYFCFKRREQLKKYMESVHRSLGSGGVLIMDCFGGSQCQEANEEETEHGDHNFSYFWDQDSFDPITNHAKFYIHFKRKGEKKREKVFSYDWRMWSIPEIRELMSEVGFSQSCVYWEGDDEDGEGNGVYQKVEIGEECESWVSYIVGVK